MNPVSSLQAAVITAVTQVAALLVGFAVLSSSTEAIVINAATAVINVAFLVANSLHANAAAKTPNK